MRIVDSFGSGQPLFSFEFFPPKTDEGVKNLYHTIEELAPLRPSYVSVTYGAGGSTRDLTVSLVSRIKREIGLETMAHLTCVGHSADELDGILSVLRDEGIENVLPLRGDPPRGQTVFQRPENGFGYSSELAAFIRSKYDFCLAGACYPEGHVECPDLEIGIQHLQKKVEAGVDFLITQLFFDPADYFSFVKKARAAGIEKPIVAGIMPVTNVSQLERFTSMCGSSIPVALREKLEPIRDDEEAVVQAGIDWATEQCRTLLAGGAPGIHFYTLNRSHSTRHVFENLHATG
jgi:methylenetetrahydrofolate reductase (NADPH)